MAGKPFTETWADMKARKAARAAGGNGPVVQVQAPASQAPSAPDQTARILTLLENITNQLNIQDIRLTKLEGKKPAGK